MESKHTQEVQISNNTLYEMLRNLQTRTENLELEKETQKKEIEKLNSKVEKLEVKNKALKEENGKLKERNKELEKDIQGLIASEIQAIVSTPKKTKTPRKKYQESDSEHTSVTDSDSDSDKTFDAKCKNSFELTQSEQFNPIQGLIDTFTFFSNSDRSKSQKLKEYACYGKNKELTEEARKNNRIVNGRGTPDSIFSRIKGFYDKTPLMIAAQYGNLESSKELIKNGANPNLYDREGYTALDYANQNHNWEVADFLRTQNAVCGVEIEELRLSCPPKFGQVVKRVYLPRREEKVCERSTSHP